MPVMPPERPQLPAGLVGDRLPVDRVLYEAEYPVLFTTTTVQGQPLLAYVADDTQAEIVTLLAPLSSSNLAALEVGTLGVREALSASWLWLHMAGRDGSRLWAVDAEEIPADHLPLPGTPVSPDHEPVLRTRAIGENVVLGRMPASVVAFVADSTRKAFKTLLDFTFDRNAEGRPTEEHRALYDLPVQQFAFASFELSFGAPPEDLFERREVLAAADKLRQGLLWASDVANEHPLPVERDDERAAILRAVLLLTPPASGAITEVQVSGTWVSRGRVRLTRASRLKVRRELKAVEDEFVASYIGRVRELDVDNLSFILRETEDGIDRRGVFTEDMLDDAQQFMYEGTRIGVVGVERQGRLYVLAMSPLPLPE
jgi:hypothetical protein